MDRRLQDSRRVTLDASGNGTVTFGPLRPNERWRVTRISVQCSSNTLEAVAQVYRGTVNVGSRISGTVSGSTGDTDPDLDESLWSGELLSVQWTGGDVGASATASFWGEVTTV